MLGKNSLPCYCFLVYLSLVAHSAFGQYSIGSDWPTVTGVPYADYSPPFILQVAWTSTRGGQQRMVVWRDQLVVEMFWDRSADPAYPLGPESSLYDCLFVWKCAGVSIYRIRIRGVQDAEMLSLRLSFPWR